MIWRSNKKAKQEKEAQREAKVADSQRALIDAATSTANMAADVTRTMKKRMEDAIRQFESTARIMNDGLLICTLKGVVQAYNGAAEQMFGITDEVAVSLLFEHDGRPMVSADELYGLVKAKKRAMQGKHLDGTLFPVHVGMSVLERSDGSTVVLLAVQDMTLMTKAFEGNFEASAVALSSGEIVAANPGVHRLFGFSAEEILGKNVNTIMQSKDRHGTHLNIVFEVARMQWMGAEAVLITMREVGTPKKVQKTAPKRENGVDLICTYGPDFLLTSANATFLRFFGLKKKDALGSDVRSYMPYDEVGDLTNAIRSLTVTESFYRSHYVSDTEEGVQTIHDWIDHGIFDTEGRLIEVHRTGRDVGQALAKALAKRKT